MDRPALGPELAHNPAPPTDAQHDGTRLFLLTNLVRKQPRGPASAYLGFRNPLGTIEKFVAAMGGFPYTPPAPGSKEGPRWDGPVMLLRGTKSPYVNEAGLEATKVCTGRGLWLRRQGLCP